MPVYRLHIWNLITGDKPAELRFTDRERALATYAHKEAVAIRNGHAVTMILSYTTRTGRQKILAHY